MKIFYILGCIISTVGCVAVATASKEAAANHDTGQMIMLTLFMILMVGVAVYCLRELFILVINK